ncbi:replication-relaxation family protein [Streptomyces sp. NBC_00444]|uniref:replication-relaxation family protein n=1 Tax=Streptomyces sp. NBC_00444 TaxID=2975744 RepID=UPI002E213FDB
MVPELPPQRALRGHRPHRPTPRTAATGDHLARLASHLTPRDRWLARMLHEHHVLTTHQIAALAWSSRRAANLRLLQLYKWRAVDRFQPFVTSGSAPMHYVLDVAGAATLAHEHGLDVRDLNYRHDRALGVAHSLRLAHIIGVNTFFTALVARGRRPRALGHLTAWWSETRCAQLFGDLVRPDAYGRWLEDRTELEWFLEFDRGTERPASRLAARITGYAQLATTTGIITPVLVWLPSARREATVRRALAEVVGSLVDPSLVPLATTSADLVACADRTDPAVARWLPLRRRNGPGRLRLAELHHIWDRMLPLSESPAVGTNRQAPSGGRLPPPDPMPPRLPDAMAE